MWKHNLKDWEKVNKDVYKFCLEQAEKRLKDVIDDSEKITSRTYSLIGILVPILTVCIGIILKYLTKQTHFDILVAISSLSSIVLLFSLLFLVKLVGSRDVWLLGTEPIDILKSEFVEIETLTEEETSKYIILREIQQVQYKIERNKSVNKVRIETFSCCLKVVVLATTILLSLILCLTIF